MTQYHPNTEREKPSAWVGIVFLATVFLLMSGTVLLAVHITRGITP